MHLPLKQLLLLAPVAQFTYLQKLILLTKFLFSSSKYCHEYCYNQFSFFFFFKYQIVIFTIISGILIFCLNYLKLLSFEIVFTKTFQFKLICNIRFMKYKIFVFFFSEHSKLKYASKSSYRLITYIFLEFFSY